MGRVVVLGVFVADTAYRADRQPKLGETIMGRSFALGRWRRPWPGPRRI
jgi:ribokinase